MPLLPNGKQQTIYARKITKGEFVDLVDKVWDICFSLPNTGLYHLTAVFIQ
ncbi:hypothetical protein E2C01_048309 [Portunus trituberculatus]|uniref:Uncharacterized protein n=1 Tax=Portunus trituberculatus TaxID=210409 RepID=A0A5B7GCZ4_PORTR|nr:hypothetical protein [Portunus trituberculatus]